MFDFLVMVDSSADESTLIERIAELERVKSAAAAGQARAAAALDAVVEHIFGCFGAERVLWGSDWPVLTLRASYRQWLNMALELVQRHAPGQEEAVFGANAVRCYRLTPGG